MGGGGGGKGSRSQAQTTGSQALESIALQIESESRPSRQEMFRQVLEGLRTGGIGARIPIVSAGQEASRLATSRALQGTTESLVRSRLAGTPFGERVMAETRLAGEMETAGIPTRETARIIELFPGIATGTSVPVITGLGQASASQAQLASAQTAGKASMTSALLGAGGQVGRGLATPKPCYIAYSMFGPTREFRLIRWWVNVAGNTWRAKLTRVIYFVLRPLFRSLLREAEQRLEVM